MKEFSNNMTSVSVIIPYYNQGKFLQSAVQSALSSYQGDMEVLIINDGSTEAHTRHYCNQAKNLDPRVRIINKENGGLSSARNMGLREAKGKYIQFLDCDDILLPGKIQRQVNQLTYSRSKFVSICGYYVSDERGRALRDETATISSFPFTLESFLFEWERGFSIPIHCGLFHSSVFDGLVFDEKLYGKEDWVFWSSLIGNLPETFIFCPFVGVIYRLHDKGMTRSVKIIGESWLQASQVLGTRFSTQYPKFANSSTYWHQKFYQGARLSDKEKQNIFIKTSYIAESQKQQNSTTTLEQNITLKLERLSSTDLPPLITFVVPVYNHKDYLKQCITSLVNQKTTIPYEIVVVDDHSKEIGVLDTLCSIDTGWVPYKVFQNNENYGISVTQNLAVQKARGKYIAFVDCDDYISETTIDTLAETIANTSADYIFTDRFHIDEKGKLISRFNYGGYSWITPSGSIENDVLLGMIASHLKVIRRHFYLELGGSNSNYSGVQDWDFALRTIGKGKFHYLNSALYHHRIHQKSVTSSGSTTQLWMTNVLRRKYLEKLGGKRDLSMTIEVNHLDTKVVPYISELFQKGARFTYLSKQSIISDGQIDMLREFNSYFDRILVPKGNAASLMGYLWHHKVVSENLL